MAEGDEGGRPAVGPGRLRSVPWFAGWTDEHLADVARLAERLRIEAGEVIVREGRVGRELFVILDGTATVSRKGRVIDVIDPGGFFGELAAPETVPRTTTVTAATDLDVLVIGPRQFEAMMQLPGLHTVLTARGRPRRGKVEDGVGLDGHRHAGGDGDRGTDLLGG